MIWLLVKYVLSAAIRDRLFVGFLLLVVVTISLSTFLGSSAITEKDQFSLVFMGSGLRVGGMLVLVLFIISYLRRSFEGQDVEFLLSRPISRFQFLSAHFLAFLSLATIMTLLVVGPFFFMSSGAVFQGVLLWSVSLWVEFVIMATIALFFGMVLSSAVTATVISLAFYTLGRLIGDILGIIHSSAVDGLVAVMEKIMLAISVFVPRLDLLGQTSWLVHGAVNVEISWPFFLLQAFVFCGLLFSATLLDLNRRQF